MVTPRTFYVIKMFRLYPAMKVFKLTKGIRKLLYAFLISLPALVNIASLLFLIMYMYAIIGMNFFMNVKLQQGLTTTVNFQTISKSFLLVFRLSTVSNWNEILLALMLTDEDPGEKCDNHYDIQSMPDSIDPVTVNGNYFKFVCFFSNISILT